MCPWLVDSPEGVLLYVVQTARLRTASPQPRSLQVSARVSMLAPLSRHFCLPAAQRTPDSMYKRVWPVRARTALPDTSGAQTNILKSTGV